MRIALSLVLLIGCAEFPEEQVDGDVRADTALADAAPDDDDGVPPPPEDMRVDPPPDAGQPRDIGSTEADADRSACDEPVVCADDFPLRAIPRSPEVGGASVTAFGDGYVIVWDGGAEGDRHLRTTVVSGLDGEPDMPDREIRMLPADGNLSTNARPVIGVRHAPGGARLGLAWQTGVEYRFTEIDEDQMVQSGETLSPRDAGARVVLSLAATPTRWHMATTNQGGQPKVRSFPGETAELGGHSHLAIAGGVTQAMAVAVDDERLVARAYPDAVPPGDRYEAGPVLPVPARQATTVAIAAFPDRDRWLVVWSEPRGVWAVEMNGAFGVDSDAVLLDCAAADALAVTVGEDGSSTVAMLREASVSVRRLGVDQAEIGAATEVWSGRGAASPSLAHHPAQGTIALVWVSDEGVHYSVTGATCP